MANQKHVKVLMLGVSDWNKWRRDKPRILPNLSGANLDGADLRRANLSGANLSGANLGGADLRGADLSRVYLVKADLSWAFLEGADLSESSLGRVNLSESNLDHADLFGASLYNANLIKADLYMADLRRADLDGADLSEADLCRADLRKADLRGANLSKANLREANLTEANLSDAELNDANLSDANLSDANLSGANFSGANLRRADLTNSKVVDTKLLGTDLSGCNIYGISVWNIKTDENTKQNSLVITQKNESIITVDNLEVAQFIYLLLNNQKIRDVINTISNKAVLILGKFGTRLSNLDAIRVKLRDMGFLPILFDFEKPTEKDTAETIITLAGLAKFVVADLTEPRSIPLELKTIVSNFPTLPVQLLLQNGENTFGMVDHILNFNSISGISGYNDISELIDNFQSSVIDPVEKWKRLNRDRIEANLKSLI